MRRSSILPPFLLSLLLLGCSASQDITVTGTVTRNSEPLANAVVHFIPAAETGSLGGFGTTGPDGKYTLTAARGGASIPPGDYKVTVSLFLRPDGSPGDPNVPPIESDASEKLPAKYSSRDTTTLTAKVDRDNRVHDFKLLTPKADSTSGRAR